MVAQCKFQLKQSKQAARYVDSFHLVLRATVLVYVLQQQRYVSMCVCFLSRFFFVSSNIVIFKFHSFDRSFMTCNGDEKQKIN